MNTPDRPKVEAILPLTFLQNALLFHSLSVSDDQGFIHVKLDMYGRLDIEKLQEFWLHLVKRHDAFRSSIHWEEIKTPVQVVHKEADHGWKYVDLRSENKEIQYGRIDEFMEKDKAAGFDFNKASISRVAIFQLSNDHHLLIWSCHHLLLDGWSSANVIRELAELYSSSNAAQPSSLPPVPSSKDYLRDLTANDMDSAKSFWQEYLDGFNDPFLISKFSVPNSSSQCHITKKFSFVDSAFRNLKLYSKTHKLTITSILQMAWAIVLSGIDDSEDIVFGNIVSVRSPRLKNADMMCGLFTNMLPIRVQINAKDIPSTLGERIKKSQGNTRDYAYVSLDDLRIWTDWPGYLPLFDHIFVVENFPWKDIDLGDVKFSNFRSGITSSYPLTVVAKIDDCLKLDFIYNQSKISDNLINILGQNLTNALEAIISDNESQLGIIIQNQTPIDEVVAKLDIEENPLNRAQNYRIDQPSNPLELTLTGIWENLFMRDGIGINDNFFDIGGKSLLAVRLFQNIQKELNVNAPPIMILQYPTISKLASYISGNKSDLKWKSLIPLRIKGNKNPLFCLHAKGGYVFFYNKLASYLNENQPIYALQPRGLNGEDPLYDSIEEMANHYIQEIKTIQPQGPYNILATCFSNVVGIEIAQQLQSEGDEIGFLFMVDAAPGRSVQEAINKQGMLAKVNYKIKQTTIYSKSKEIYKKIKRSEDNIVVEEDFSVNHEKHLEKIFDNYEAKPYMGRITLIRSSEFGEMRRKDFHIDDWLKIVSKDDLEILTVQGHHKTLFLEPEVRNLAETFNNHLA